MKLLNVCERCFNVRDTEQQILSIFFPNILVWIINYLYQYIQYSQNKIAPYKMFKFSFFLFFTQSTN